MKVLRYALFLVLFVARLGATITPTADVYGPQVPSSFTATLTTGLAFQQATDLLIVNAGQPGAVRSPATVLNLGTDYVVTGGGYNSANQMQVGSFTLTNTGPNSPLIGDNLYVIRNTPANQLTVFANGGYLTAAMIEQALDKQATLAQMSLNNGLASLHVETYETANAVPPKLLMTKNARSGNILAFDANGNVLFLPSSASALPYVNTITAGVGITTNNSSGNVLISNSGVINVAGTGSVNGITLTGNVTGTGNLTLGGTLGGINNSQLSNSSITITPGTGLSGGGTVSLGGTITLNNTGGTVTGVSVIGYNGIGTNVINYSTNPLISLNLGNITPNAVTTNSLTVGSLTGPVVSIGGTYGVTGQSGTGVPAYNNAPSITNPTLLGTTNAVNVTTNGLQSVAYLRTTGLTGYLYGNSSSNVSASTTIPAGSVTGLATVATTGNYYDLTNRPTITSGTVTSVSGTGSVNGITLTGTVTSSGNLTLGGTLSGISNSQLTNNSITITAGTGLSGGGNIALGGSTTLSVSNAPTATTANNLYGGAAYQIPYQSAANTTSFIPNGTAGQVLLSVGTITSPSWSSALNLSGAIQGASLSTTGNLTAGGTTTLATSLSGLLKATSGVVSTATANSDYVPATTGNSSQLLASNGSGGMANVNVGSGLSYSGGTLSSTSGGGSVTNVTVTGNSGVLAGVTTPTTTPSISIGLGNITPLSVTTNAGSFTTLNSSGQTLLATSSGNVGVGTSNPIGGLNVNAASSDPVLWVTRGDNVAGATSTLRLGNNNATYKNSSPFIQGLVVGGINQYNLTFGTSNAADAIERLRLDYSGQLLLGTTTPLALGAGAMTIGATTASSSTSTGALVVGNGSSGGLGVGGAIYAGGNITTTSSGSVGLIQALGPSGNTSAQYFKAATNATNSLFLGVEGSAGGYLLSGSPAYSSIVNSAFNFPLLFGTNNVERMRIDTAGNVGIGTTSPSQRLSIIGGGMSVLGTATLGVYGIPGTFSYEYPVFRQYIGDGSGYSIAFTSRTGSTNTDLIKINDTGAVLQVNGAAQLSGYSNYVTSTTPSSSTTSGALQVAGGVGIQGSLWAGDYINESPSSGAAYILSNRPSGGVEVGFQFQTVGNIDWNNYEVAGSNTLNWYNGNTGHYVMELTTAGGLQINTYGSTGFTVTQQTNGGYGYRCNALASSSVYYYAGFYANGTYTGQIVSTDGSTTQYQTSSDARLKTNFHDWSLGDKFDQLPIGEFNWLKDGSVGHGTLAQEMYKVYPDAVVKGDDAPTLDSNKQGATWGVDYGKLTVPVIAEVKALRSRVKTLEQEQADTQKQLNDLTAKFNQYISTHP